MPDAILLGQSLEYFPGLKEQELRRYLLFSDLNRSTFYDLEENTHVRFALSQSHEHVEDFAIIIEAQKTHVS